MSLKKNLKRMLRVVASVLAIVVLILSGSILWLQYGHGYTPKIKGRNSIALLKQVKLGLYKQWILIRGDDQNSPIVLFLHGGPGMSEMYIEHAFGHELEKDFIVVEWDRLGAGKSYHKSIPESAMTVSREISDTHQLIEMLCSRFHKKKVYLVGHSYGSYLGMLVASRYPKLIAAYIGVGQVSDPQKAHEAQDRFLRKQAKLSGNTELMNQLNNHKPINREQWIFKYHGELYHATSWWPLLRIGLLAPEYKLSEAMAVQKGVNFTHKYMIYDVIKGSLTQNITSLKVPVYFFLGRHDYTTPSSLAVSYLDSLTAPFKKVVWFENSAHFPFLEEPVKFAKEMLQVYEKTSY